MHNAVHKYVSSGGHAKYTFVAKEPYLMNGQIAVIFLLLEIYVTIGGKFVQSIVETEILKADIIEWNLIFVALIENGQRKMFLVSENGGRCKCYVWKEMINNL